jgi:hypothetical protein
VPSKPPAPTRLFEGAELLFRNFRGVGPPEKKFNAEGDRNFNLVIPTELVQEMMDEGWNVKCLRPFEEGDEPKCIVEIAVEFRKGMPPNITLLTSRGRTRLTAETVGSLDHATILKTDLIIRGSHWDVNGRQGMKAYLQTMFVEIYEDPLELKYSETPEDVVFDDAPPFEPDKPAF